MEVVEMPPENLILEALHGIRGSIDDLKDAVGVTNQRLDQTNQRLDQTNQRIDQTNQRIDQTNQRLDQSIERLDQTIERLDQTNQRLDDLRVFTVRALTELNAKVDRQGSEIHEINQHLEQHGTELRILNQRLDNFLTGEGAKQVKRIDLLEEEVRRIARKVDH